MSLRPILRSLTIPVLGLVLRTDVDPAPVVEETEEEYRRWLRRMEHSGCAWATESLAALRRDDAEERQRTCVACGETFRGQGLYCGDACAARGAL